MFLKDFYNLDVDKHFKKLSRFLYEDYGIEIQVYEELSDKELSSFIEDLRETKKKLMLENDFGTAYQDIKYAQIHLLLEAICILKEIRPKRVKTTVNTKGIEKND